MAKKPEATADENVVAELVRGKKLLQLDPVEVSADPKYNGRFTAPSKVDVRDMAASIRKVGQIQPVLVTLIPGTKDFRMVVGFTRQAALQFLNESLADGETPYVMEAVEVSGADAAMLLEINIEENTRRKNLTPMDKAHAVKMFEESGKKDAEIAGLMGFKSHASVSQHRKLLSLAANVQKRIHSGEISAEAGFDLAKLEPEQQQEVVKELAPVESPVDEKTGKATKKVKAETVRKAVEKKGGFAAGIRKLPELRKLIAAVRNDPTMPSGASYVCALVLMYVEKSKNEGNVLKAFRESCIDDEELRKFLVKKDLYGKTQEQRDADKAKADAAIAKEKAEKKAEADKMKAKATAKKAKEKAAA